MLTENISANKKAKYIPFSLTLENLKKSPNKNCAFFFLLAKRTKTLCNTIKDFMKEIKCSQDGL